MKKLVGLILALVVVSPATDAAAQVEPGVLNAPELLCFINIHKNSGLDHPRGSLTCRPGEAGADFFFLALHWQDVLGGQADCGCDFDFDGLTGCEEVLLCTYPGVNDSDGDCLSDGLEIALGLDPLNPDSDGDETPDGEDDSDENEVPDGEEDFDQDGLSNCQEAMLGTNPMDRDSDGDGFHDGAEVDVETGELISDPKNPDDLPPIFVVSAPPVRAVLTVSSGSDAGGLTYSTFVSAPPVTAVIASSQTSTGSLPLNIIVTKPPTTVIVPSSQTDAGGVSFNVSVSKPPVSIVVASSNTDAGGLDLNTVTSDPPVVVEIETD